MRSSTTRSSTSGRPDGRRERTPDEACRHFRGWRVNYEAAAYALDRFLDAPPALWSGPRRQPGLAVAPERPPHHATRDLDQLRLVTAERRAARARQPAEPRPRSARAPDAPPEGGRHRLTDATTVTCGRHALGCAATDGVTLHLSTSMHLPATTPPVSAPRAMRRRILATAVALAALADWSAPPAAHAATAAHYPAGSTGFDISFPQCQSDYPDDPGFGIVGVTGGRAFTGNPCFASEYRWAGDARAAPSVYFNVNYARPTYQSFPAHALHGPAGTCAPTQNACTAYNYGWNAADDAVGRALEAGADPAMWWLDVETENDWSDRHDLNVRVISAALDLLRARHLAAGIYSINEMWSQIAGAGFRPGVPAWYADQDGGGYASAPDYCDSAHAFTGGAVWLVQWAESVDHDYACPGAPPSKQPAPPPECLPRPVPLPLCVVSKPPSLPTLPGPPRR